MYNRRWKETKIKFYTEFICEQNPGAIKNYVSLVTDIILNIKLLRWSDKKLQGETNRNIARYEIISFSFKNSSHTVKCTYLRKLLFPQTGSQEDFSKNLKVQKIISESFQKQT